MLRLTELIEALMSDGDRLFIKDLLAYGEDGAGVEALLDGALGLGVKGAQLRDLIAPALQAHGVRLKGGEDVDDVAPDGEGARVLDDLDLGVAAA